MTPMQKTAKYLAIALAVLIIVGIIAGIVTAIGVIGFMFNKEEKGPEEMQTFELSDNITSLDIKIGAADFSIVFGDAFCVESGSGKVTVTEKDGKLTIKEKSRFGFGFRSEDITVVLHIPENTVFDKIEISTGAGKVSICSLVADSIKLDFGAGNVTVDELVAKERADIGLGAGKVEIRDGALKDLDLDMGVGELKLTSALTGDCDIDCGVGAAEFNIIGSVDEYMIDIQKGLGETKLNGKSFSGVYGDGANRLDIDGGVGRVEVNFTEE